MTDPKMPSEIQKWPTSAETAPVAWPIDVMSGAEWNLLDAKGCRIAICGYDKGDDASNKRIAGAIVGMLRNLRSEADTRKEANERDAAELAALRGQVERLEGDRRVTLTMLSQFYGRACQIDKASKIPCDGPRPIQLVRHIIDQYESVIARTILSSPAPAPPKELEWQQVVVSLLVEKLPAFDPTWSRERQLWWFDTFSNVAKTAYELHAAKREGGGG